VARRTSFFFGSLLGLAIVVGCAGLGGVGGGPVRISEFTGEGDGTRRASTRLVVGGLASDQELRPQLALSRYERAIQIDPTNPFAYLALARHFADRLEPTRTLEYLDQAELLLESQGLHSPRVEAHLVGLRGSALEAAGRTAEGAALLDRARDLAPFVWDDARLSPEELR
jgi:tetratricopeptide (TPR) repeat protein